jgi:pimeloyl-ACP methyl ester carboxylesterase
VRRPETYRCHPHRCDSNRNDLQHLDLPSRHQSGPTAVKPNAGERPESWPGADASGNLWWEQRRMGGVAERSEVKSGDGGSIAIWVEGDGPPLVLVHGSVSDHTVFAPLVGELQNEFTIFAMDRRGFGASRDDPGYSAEREFSDVAAVVDAVAAQTGEPVVLFGSSWGASCALGAARDLPSLRALVLYEPSLGLRYPPGSIDRMEERVAAGDNEGAIVEMAAQIAGLTEDEIAERRAAPNWQERVATAPTMAREARIEESWDWQTDRLGSIPVPTLLITGSETPPELAEVTSLTAAAIPGARVHVLAGHGHVAHVSEPGVVAQVLRDWLE